MNQLIVCAALFILSATQHDSSFDASVLRPAYNGNGPVVLLDEAHQNIFTVEGGRSRAVRDLLTNDGYRVRLLTQLFTAEVLDGAAVVITAAARGKPALDAPAYTDDEVAALYAWVQQGGALLIATDHPPFNRAMASLAKRFGIDIRDGGTFDAAHMDPGALEENLGPNADGRIVFNRENGLLVSDPVTNGRNSSEQVHRVLVFGGTSLDAGNDVSMFLRLAPTAIQRTVGGETAPPPPVGRAQGIAATRGRGRVVVLADANGFVTTDARTIGSRTIHVGLSRREFDNRQLLLNIIHWLSSVIS